MPLPASWLRVWANGFYPAIQPGMSAASALFPFALLDALTLSAVLGIVAVIVWARRQRRASMGAAWLLFGAATGWLLFQALWGWHYQEPTLEQRLLGTADPTALAARALPVTTRAVIRLNELYADVHARPWPEVSDLGPALGPAVQSALADAGRRPPPELPAPKVSMFDGYFRRTGIDGMTNPFGLEVILHARLLPVERGPVLAHEWAHLGGLADESDASFVAWMAGVRTGGPLEYAAWLAVLPHLAGALSGEDRSGVLGALEEGPRSDLRAVARRGLDRWPALQLVAWRVYDRFLKVNRVHEGIARYDAVTRLLLLAADEETGRLRLAATLEEARRSAIPRPTQ